MKLRIIKLTPESFARLLQGKPASFASNLPADAEIFDVKMNLFTKQISVVARSESFEDVPEAMPIPELQLTKPVDSKAGSKPVAAPLKPQVATTLEAKSMVAKLPQPQPNRIASKMENEFSPDQRKLLSFTTKEDRVIAKPVVFLKAEWEDINEVVRSLGGKWVKGDIISYWEIPLQ
jgi:hypothetical protein